MFNSGYVQHPSLVRALGHEGKLIDQACIFYLNPPPRGGAAGRQKRQNRAATRRGRKKIIRKGEKRGKIRKIKVKKGILLHTISNQGSSCPDFGQKCPFLLK